MEKENGVVSDCGSHWCEVCEEDLYTGKWWHNLIFAIVLFGLMGSTIVFASYLNYKQAQNNQISPPDCYLLQEHLPKGNADFNAVNAKRTFFDCKNF